MPTSPAAVAVGDKPSYTYSFSGGLLTVNGTTAADTLAFPETTIRSWYATINGDYLTSPWVPPATSSRS